MNWSKTLDFGALLDTQTALVAANDAGGTTNGPSLDRTKFAHGTLHVTVGSPTGAPTSFSVDVKVQESDDGTTWSDVSGAAIPTITTANTDAKIDVKLIGLKRYVRAVSTVSFSGGTAPAVPVAAVFTFGGVTGNAIPV